VTKWGKEQLLQAGCVRGNVISIKKEDGARELEEWIGVS